MAVSMNYSAMLHVFLFYMWTYLLQCTEAPSGLCSKGTPNSFLITWFNAAWKTAEARHVQTTASITVAIALWTAFQQIYKADIRAARY